MKKFILSMLSFLILLAGCAGNNEAADWKISPTFTENNQVLYGIEGKFGMINMNGPKSPVFPAGQGRLYRIYFFEDIEGHSEYEITATHQNTGDIERLIETKIGEQTEAKFGFDEAGLWKIDVTVDGESYTDFIIEAN